MINHEGVLVMPHLGASTKEAEINCAVMVASSLKSYLETGNILNSVNFPDVKLAINSPHRLTITNKNVPNIIGQFTSILGNAGINIDDLSHGLDEIGYTILNVDKPITEIVLHEISNIEGVMKTNILFKLCDVSYLGPKGSFTQIALTKYFGDDLVQVSQKTIGDVFKSVELNDSDYGIVPIENSFEGSVNNTHDLLIGSDIQVYDEIQIRINQCLLQNQ